MMDYREKPFYLNQEQIAWMENTFENMTFEEKIGQLFCPIVMVEEEEQLRALVEKTHIGGMLFREGPGEEVRQKHEILQSYSKIPLLTASNLESGGDGSAVDGTFYGRQMLVAATGRVERAYQLGKVAGREGAAVGVNWAFAPVVDIDRNYHNPITNVRTFGDDKEQIKAMAGAYIRGAAEEGVVSTLKHFPGDGMDERDQHLLTSVNPLSCQEWDESYGDIYRTLIEGGAMTIMCGHIALPAYEEYYDGKPCRQVIPASLSKNILTHLLREKLGFRGLVVTDSTAMVGFCCGEERRRAVPLAIENGCDMFLFNKNLQEDIRYMTEGLMEGILSQRRLSEAVRRILALKAALDLPKKQKEKRLVPPPEALKVLRCPRHMAWARECADEGVTLVKDTQALLPLSPEKHHRVLLNIMGDFPSNERVREYFAGLLEKEGFAVDVYEKEAAGPERIREVEALRASYDLVLYLGNIESRSNRTVSRLNWTTRSGSGNDMPWFINELPVLFVSLGNPYHLLDVPMIQTYVNGYCNSEFVMDAVMDKLLGRSSFQGKNPIDPFCGRWDTRW